MEISPLTIFGNDQDSHTKTPTISKWRGFSYDCSKFKRKYPGGHNAVRMNE